MRLRIRLANEADIPSVRDLLVRSWHDTYDAIYGVEKVTDITDRWHSADNLTRQLRIPLSLFLVAEADGQLVGTSKANGFATGDVMLDRLYVDPNAQRSGVGAALLNVMEKAFPYAGSVKLEVEPKNAKAIAFYGKHGFVTVGMTPNCGGSSGLQAERMQKRLRDGAVSSPLMIRPVRDADAQDLIGLITLCFAEYAGCYFDPHGDMPDIIRPAQSRLATDGAFEVVEDTTGRICACIGLDFPDKGVAELHRLYVRPDMRGRGLAKELTRRMEDDARKGGATRMILWSDTRFTMAHALYEGLGYIRGETTRSLGDISQSREFFFEKALA
jgi:GNAT superfamily N-acetyltransferase